MVYDMVMTGYTGLIFIPGIYYISTVCILFRMRYAKYILKLRNLYLFYTKHILPGLVDVLGIYLRYDNIGDMEFKRIDWICSFFGFPTRSHVTYNSGI